MRTKQHVLAAWFVTTALCACSQDPAPIVDRSRSDFSQERSVASLPAKARPVVSASRSNDRGPIQLTPEVDPSTQQSVGVQTIASRDLAAPGTEAPMEEAKPRNSVSSKGFGPVVAGPAEVAQPEPFQTARNRHLDQPGAVQGTVIYRSQHHSKEAQQALDKALSTPKLTQPAPQLVESKHFIWPVEGKVVSHFGPKKAGVVNEGINIAADSGDAVHASASGVVAYAGDKIPGYGNMVLIKHPGGKTTTYAHLDKIKVKKSQQVSQGDALGTVGSTGNVKSPQLHFAIREGTKAIDPETLIPRNLASVAF